MFTPSLYKGYIQYAFMIRVKRMIPKQVRKITIRLNYGILMTYLYVIIVNIEIYSYFN